jgi:hypothetical protein
MPETSNWRVTHRIVWSAKATLLSGALFILILALMATVVPVGLLVEEPHEVGRAGKQLRDALGFGGSAEAWAGIAWCVVALLALPWAWVVRGLWRAVSEQLRDLFGADRFIEGTITRIDVTGTGSRRRHRLHVGGEAWLVPFIVARDLSGARLVRLRVTRFNKLVLEVAVPPPVPSLVRVAFRASGDARYPYAADVDGQRWTVRINEFPEEPSVYSLLINGQVAEELMDWPAAWTRPTAAT